MNKELGEESDPLEQIPSQDSIQSWVRLIQSKPGIQLRPTFFITDVEYIKSPDMQIGYLLVGEEDECGLDEGIYVMTNLTPQDYDSNEALLKLITAYVTLALSDTSINNSKSHNELDFENAINFNEAGLSSIGTVVFKLSKPTHQYIQQTLDDVEKGVTKADITLIKEVHSSLD